MTITTAVKQARMGCRAWSGHGIDYFDGWLAFLEKSEMKMGYTRWLGRRLGGCGGF